MHRLIHSNGIAEINLQDKLREIDYCHLLSGKNEKFRKFLFELLLLGKFEIFIDFETVT